MSRPDHHLYWAAFLAATIAHALTSETSVARTMLRQALNQFTKSESCGAELRKQLANTKGE